MQGKSRSLHRKEVHGELVQVHPDLLQSREMLHHRRPILTAIAGELVSAEWRVGLDLVPGIDPHGAGLGLFCDPMGALEAARLPTCGKSIDDVIADPDRFLFVAESDDAADGTEDLLLRDLHLIGDVREHGGLVIEAVRQLRVRRPSAAADEPGALTLADLDVALDLADLLLAHA